MFRQGSNSGNKRVTSGARLSYPNIVPSSPGSNKTLEMGRSSKTNPLSAMGIDYTITAPGGDPEYIMQLVNDVRKFSDVLLSLKEAFHSKENQNCLQHVVDERLGELVHMLKAVISKHQALNSSEILGAAGTVIAKVKGVNFKDINKENKGTICGEIYTSIDTLAFTFGNVVSDFLMGDVDSGSRLGYPQARSRSFENLSEDSEGCNQERNDLEDPPLSTPELSPVEQVDLLLLRNDSGVESALLYAKAWSKYTKDVLTWMEKRLSLDMECSKSFVKMAESAKAVASQQDYMPFRDIYVSAFKNEIEYNQVLLQTAAALQTNKFVQPLLVRKNDLDKQRKEIKEQWQRELKKMSEAESAVKKARLLKMQKREEYEKARSSTSRTEEEQPATGGRTLEKKRRVEEEALQRAEEAQEQYKACVADLEAKKVGLSNVKSEILAQIRKLVFQCDLTLKAVTVNWFQMQQAQSGPLPVNYQSLCEQAKKYEPGQRYSEFVCSLPKERVWLESLSQDITAPSKTGSTSESHQLHLNPHTKILASAITFLYCALRSHACQMSLHKRSLSSAHSSHGNLSQGSVTSVDNHSADEVEGTVQPCKAKIAERRSNSSVDIQAVRPQGSQRCWSSGSVGGGGMCSDSESAGGSSESRSMDSPTASPGDFKRRLPRTPSTGTMSSADDLDEREPSSPLDNGLAEMVMETASSPGPFRNAQMSKAAHTHKLRKLRAPSKCRECDSLVVFHGAECEECSLACHKKCLETLAIQCGHKKLQGRLHLFGIDFAQVAKNSPDGIPFIIKKCTSEIESRALYIKGIYRVNGAKSRVEKLCQAFENGKDLVELSDLHPHDISNVLKLYLRQLPEPLILYRYYNDVIGLAKETQNMDETDSPKGKSSGEQLCLSIELKRVIFKIRDLLRQLPAAHYKTLQFLIAHLHRVTEQAEENKMTSSNLGIIFGPTLIKPRQLEAEVSLSSLVDYPHQARMVEVLIKHNQMIFDVPLSSVSPTSPTAPQAFPNIQDKEPKLSRHSRSLMDIKESAKVFKRHSSVISSAQLMEELKTGENRAQTPGEGSDMNGVGSAPVEMQKSTSVFSRSGASSRMVQLRPQRSKQVSRPISMPVDRLLNEHNSFNTADHEPATIQETTEPEKPSTPRLTNYYRNPFIDTQTLRRTWDKQYRHYDVTPRTAMIVANLPPSGVMDKVKSAATVPGTSSINETPHSSPYTSSPDRVIRKDGTGQSSMAPINFRAPRMLKPPPGTFYKPQSGSQFRSFDSMTKTVSAAPTTTTGTVYTTAITIVPTVATATIATVSRTVDTPPTTPTISMTTATMVAKPTVTMTLSAGTVSVQTGGVEEGQSECDSLSPITLSPPQSPSSSAEELSPTENKPLYQRRNRRMHELEHREAHFV
ncbi:rho GTPase-activating protein 29-like isoform X2 [Myxocyprinus asiaticus]|uniref:rho GTPase-activating protein 29-like isoform X2 n=1 Tax=Myxocyprinus asiaticus TaxID=70543 RepID=UPI00222232E0|nr:rho GTPase-activating protein 29-like isoform X2 [Myxocyprinus asiaticus]